MDRHNRSEAAANEMLATRAAVKQASQAWTQPSTCKRTQKRMSIAQRVMRALEAKDSVR